MRDSQKRIERLQKEQVALQDRMNAILEEIDKGAETLTPEQVADLTAQYDAAEGEFKALGERLDREQSLQDREKAFAAKRAFPSLGTSMDAETVEVGKLAIEKDPKRGFDGGIGQYVSAVRDASLNRKSDQRLDFLAAASGLNQTVGSEGGFLVPPQFQTEIWDGMNDEGESLFARTDQYTVTGESLTFNANAETNRATGSRWGGVRAYRLAEGDQITSSKPTFRQMKLEPKLMCALVYLTDKLAGNAPALNAYIPKAVGSEFNFKVDDEIINGNGSGQMLGILNAGCTVSVAKEAGQAAATIQAENIDKMWARLHRRCRGNAVWLINQDCEPQLGQMNYAAGAGGQLVYMPPGGISGAPYATLKGRPVIATEFNASLGTVGDIILADLGYYATGTTGGVEAAVSMHLRFDYAETAFRFVISNDGQPWLASPITPYKGTANTLSSFVTLATRA